MYTRGFYEHIFALLNCDGFELAAEAITVKNFTFKYSWHGLMAGCCLPKDHEKLDAVSYIKTEHPGGHIIENTTFTYNSSGIRVSGVNDNQVMIKNNSFIDNYHGLIINGSGVRVEDNIFVSINPEMIPLDNMVDNAIGITPFFEGLPPHIKKATEDDCSDIIVINNQFRKHRIAIRISDEEVCEKIIMKDNSVIK